MSRDVKVNDGTLATRLEVVHNPLEKNYWRVIKTTVVVDALLKHQLNRIMCTLPPTIQNIHSE